MRQPGRQGWGRVGLLLSVALLSCKSAPRAREAPRAEPVHGGEARPLPTHGFAPQPGAVIAEVDGIAVLALAAPTFASLSREQRLVAYWGAQGIAARDPPRAGVGGVRGGAAHPRRRSPRRRAGLPAQPADRPPPARHPLAAPGRCRR